MASDLTLGVILGATLKSGFTGMFGKAGASVTELGKSIKQTHAQLGKINDYVRLDGALGQTRAKLAETQKQAMQLRKEMADGDGSAKLAKNLEKAEAKAIKLSDAVERQRAKLREEGDALRKAGIDTKDLSSANERLTESYDRQRAALGRTAALTARRRELMGQLRGEIAKLGGLTFLGKAAIADAVQFDTAIANIKRDASSITDVQVGKLASSLGRMATQLGREDDELAGVADIGAKLHFPADELADFSRESAKLSVLTGGALADSAAMLGDWRVNFKLAQPEVAGLMDQIVGLGKANGATVPQLSQLLTDTGALANQMGIAAPTVAALGAVMIGSGVQADKTSAGLQQLFNTLAQGSEATQQQQDALDKLGISAVQMKKALQENSPEAFFHLFDRLKQFQQRGGSAEGLLTQLVGRRNAAAFAPLLGDMGALARALDDSRQKFKYAGDAEALFQQRQQALDERLNRGKQGLKQFLGIIGDSLSPIVATAADGVARLGAVANDLAEKFPVATKVIVGATMGMLGLKSAIIGVKLLGTFLPASSLTVLREMVPGLGLAKSGVVALGGAVRGLSIGMLFSPIGLAIGLIAAGAVLVYKYWQPIKAFFTGVWQGISEAAGPTLGAIGEALKPLKPLWDAIASGIGAVFHWIGQLFQPFQATKEQLDGATSAGKTFGQALVGAFELITWPIRTNIKLIMWLGETIGEVAGWIVVKVGAAADAVAGGWNAAIGFVGGLWDGLQAKVAAVVDWIAAKIGWFVQKWDAVKGAVGVVWDKVKGAGASVGNAVGDALNAAGAAAPALAGAYAMPAMATRGAGYTDSSTHTTTISVQAAPGMDEQALAKHVRQQLDERDRANAARQRSKLGDRD